MSNSDFLKNLMQRISHVPIYQRVLIVVFTILVFTSMYQLSANCLFEKLSNEKMVEYKNVITSIYSDQKADSKGNDPIIVNSKKTIIAYAPMHAGYVVGKVKNGELNISYHFQTCSHIIVNLLIAIVITFFVLSFVHRLILFILRKNLLIFKIR